MRSKNAILNFIASLLKNSTGMILGIFATPIILFYLGEEQFAIFRILLDWFGHLSLLEFGLYGAMLSFISKMMTEKKEKLGAVLQMIFVKYSYVLMWQIGCLVVFSLFFGRLIPVSSQYQGSTWWAFVIMSVCSLFVYTQIFRGYLDAIQKGYIVSYILIAQNIMYLALAVCFVYMSYGVVGQVVAYALSLLFAALLYLYICRCVITQFFSKEMLVQEDLNIFIKQRKNNFFNELCGRISFLSDNIIITLILGPKSVTAFFLTQRLAQLLQQQLQNVSNSAWPALGELYYKNQRDVLSARIVQLTELTAAFAGISMGALIFMNKSFMYLWTGAETFSGNTTTYLACLNGGLFAITSLWGWCIAAINRSDKAAPVFFVQALINVIGSFVLTYVLGVNGPLYGTLLGVGVIAIWWLGKIIAETFNIRYYLLMRLWIVPFIVPVVFAMAVHGFMNFPLANSWALFFIWYMAFSGAFLVVVYFLLVSKQTRLLFNEKIREFIIRKI